MCNIGVKKVKANVLVEVTLQKKLVGYSKLNIENCILIQYCRQKSKIKLLQYKSNMVTILI